MGRQKGFQRNEVLDKAMQLFWKKGFADTSLSDLEKATGVNKSGLYSEFKDKDDLFIQTLAHYRDTHPAPEILLKEPLGWKNIENFLKLGVNCKGQKGCFLAHVLRELSVVPSKARAMIESNTAEVKDLLLRNIKATGVRGPEVIASHVITFNLGLALKANVVGATEMEKEIGQFLAMLEKFSESSSR